MKFFCIKYSLSELKGADNYHDSLTIYRLLILSFVSIITVIVVMPQVNPKLGYHHGNKEFRWAIDTILPVYCDSPTNEKKTTLQLINPMENGWDLYYVN